MRVLALLALAACGRIDFTLLADASGGGGVAGHDEDGDGVPDSIDVCPHVPGSQLDSDGDGIGDDCDPEPANPRQRLLLFATMQPGDVRLTFEAAGNDWMQGTDAVHFDGNSAADAYTHDLAFQSIRLAIGADIAGVPAPQMQHQIALHTASSEPHSFVELDDGHAQITHYDGSAYTVQMSQMLPMDIRAGHVVLQLTSFAGGAMSLDAGWPPGETYHLDQPGAGAAPGTLLEIDVRNVVLDLDYVWAITW